MVPTKYPTNPFESFMPNFDQFLGGRFNAMNPLYNNASMKVDVSEDETSISVTADVPGYNQDELSIDLESDGKTLTISGVREVDEEHEEILEGRQYLWQERSNQQTTRQIALPTQINRDSINASYVNGVLTIDFEKVAGNEPSRLNVKWNPQDD